jgi:LysR family hydrogen peroxide-inducible transcriptional activator
MTLTELRYIVALARERHFGRAADKCNVSQPTLSVAVKKLEDELGVALFERSAGDVRSTPIGVQVVAQAERALAEAARVTEIAAAGKDPAGRVPLRLGVIYTIGPWLLPALVPRVKALAPQMPLFIAEGYTENLLERLKSCELDVLVLALPIEEPGLVAQPVYDEAFRTLVPAAHPWAKLKSLRPEQLLDEPLLMLGAGNCFRDQVLDLCTRASQGESPQVLEGSSLETIRHMVSSGVGVTVMPASSVDGIPADDPLHSRDPRPKAT